MSCTNPKIAYLCYMPDGKKKLRFLSDSVKYEKEFLQKSYEYSSTFSTDDVLLGSKYSPGHKVKFSDICKGVGTFIKIPCGSCIECRLAYARDWATRIMLEASLYPPEQLCVLTLTYSDQNLPRRECTLIDAGKEPVRFVSTPLIKSHLQDFMKALRQGVKEKFDLDGVRFFACGEYGENPRDKSVFPYRPHFHVILFGCPVFDLVYHSKSKSGFNNYTSQFFQKFWHYGFVTVNHLEYDMASYVARYTLKKTAGKNKEFWYMLGLTPEFVNMSRRPGIGYKYLDGKESSLAETMNVSILKGDKPVTLSLPRYFVKKIEEKGFDVNHEKMYAASLKSAVELSESIDLPMVQYNQKMSEKSREVHDRLRRDLF